MMWYDWTIKSLFFLIFMNGGNFSNMSFQTFYVTREKSDCAFIPDVIKTGRKIQDKLGENVEVTISLRYGRRVLINTNIGSFRDLDWEGFLEIVDYDPLKNILLVIGSNNPKPVSTVHWLIHHAREEINAVAEINFDVSSLKKTEGIHTTLLVPIVHSVANSEKTKQIRKVRQPSLSTYPENTETWEYCDLMFLLPFLMKQEDPLTD